MKVYAISVEYENLKETRNDSIVAENMLQFCLICLSRGNFSLSDL